MNNFIYETPTKVYFGKDEELKVGKIIAEFHPKKVLVHFGGNSARKSGLLDKVENCLREENISFVELGGVVANPELPLVREGIELGKKEGVDFVLAVGGGSVLDSSKAIANGLANPEVDVWDFHCGKAVPQKTLPKGAILTLAAAGSEMSSSCVISNPETGEKRGCNGLFNRMNFAIEDPVLTYTVSPYQTACGAVDIAMHTIERYFCPGEDTYLTDAIAEAVKTKEIQVLYNPHPEDGISSSVKIGLNASLDADAVLFTVSDQPWLTSETICELIHVFLNTSKGIACVSCQGKMGNPCIFDRKYYNELLSLEGDKGGKKVIMKHLDDTQIYEIEAGRELEDIDYYESIAVH